MIRIIRVEDWETLKKLRELLYKYLEREESIDADQTRLEIEDNNVYGEYQQDKLRGYILIKRSDSSDQDFPNSLNINELFVKDEYRQKGIGSSLIKTILNSETVSEYDRIYVTYREKNSGVKNFYSKLGFVEYKKLDSGENVLVKYLVKLNI